MNDPSKVVGYHLPLEPYKERYTEWLHEVETAAMIGAGIVPHTIIPDDANQVNILRKGEVLDTVQRPVYALEQVRKLMLDLQASLYRPLEKKFIYLSDFFTPGIESLFYNPEFANVPVFAFWWAQTVDIFDFTYTHHFDWMRKYEEMVLSRVTKIYVASFELLDRCCAAFPESAEKFVLCRGLPFSTETIYKYAKLADHPIDFRDIDGVYSSRLDDEKNPNLFLDMVEQMPKHKFAICTGSEELKAGAKIKDRVKALIGSQNNLEVFAGLNKEEYYTILRRSKVQVNTSFQDWVSFTLLEALALGCLPLYPAHRSFPEALDHHMEYLYTPSSLGSLMESFEYLVGIAETGKPTGFPSPQILSRSEKVAPTIFNQIKKLLR